MKTQAAWPAYGGAPWLPASPPLLCPRDASEPPLAPVSGLFEVVLPILLNRPASRGSAPLDFCRGLGEPLLPASLPLPLSPPSNSDPLVHAWPAWVFGAAEAAAPAATDAGESTSSCPLRARPEVLACEQLHRKRHAWFEEAGRLPYGVSCWAGRTQTHTGEVSNRGSQTWLQDRFSHLQFDGGGAPGACYIPQARPAL